MKKFTRKDFFKGIAIGTISLPVVLRALIPESHAQKAGTLSDQKFEWKMVTTWPPNFPVLGEGCNLFADWVREMSGGRLDIKVYGGGEFVPSLEAFEAVSNGAADIGHGAAYYWAGKAPAAQFFASVPFGMNAQQHNAWILCGGGMELWKELYGQFNLIPMLAGNTGVQMGGWFKKEINTIEDFQGLKMRMPGLGGKVLNKAGGAPVLIAGGEIYTSLERGVIDATEWIGPYHDYKMGFHEIAKYYYSPGWHEAGTALECFINKDRYEELPSDLQAILQTASLRLNMWMLSEFEAKNTIYLKKIQATGKVEIRKFSDEVLQELRGHAEDILQELADSDPFAKRTYASFQSFKRQATEWSELTEKVFYNSLQS